MEKDYKGLFSKDGKQAILRSFTEWLELQNYEASTILQAPQRIAEFIDWCNEHKIHQDHAAAFFSYQKRRKNRRYEGGLSSSYLRVYLRTLRLFRRFLREVGNVDFEINIIYKTNEVTHHEILSEAEIKSLYEATTEDLLGLRDRAMLAVYYGCGLRRTEGVNMLVEDVLPDRNLIFVRRGKNYKQRYVPIIGKVRKDILTYLTVGRPGLLGKEHTLRFFVSITGRAIQGGGLYERFKRLMDKAKIDKPCGLHSLRHSIATHLLASGMSLEKIARFLGHQTLDTTQIYTHILHEIKQKKEN